MNLKSFPKYIYIALFFLISLAPACLFTFLYFSNADSASSNQPQANIEKGINIDFPKVILPEGINESFDDECETWINQNLPYRDVILSNINTVLGDALKIPTSNVIVGREGWIFSNETLDNYLDRNALSESEIQNIGITLSLIQERVEDNEGTFLFVPAPNKNTIYPEYMPIRYVRGSENDLTRLYKVLEEDDVNYANLKEALCAAKDIAKDLPEDSIEDTAKYSTDSAESPFESPRLFYKRDTHWTVFGAMVGYENIMAGLGKTPNSYDLNDFAADYSRKSDLDKLLYPFNTRSDEEYIVPDQLDYEGFEFMFPTGVTDTKAQLENFMSDKEDHDNNFTTMQRTPEDSSSLYMIRDSFGRALLPYMIDSFAEATFVRTTTPSIENSLACSDVVYEICERNLKNIISSAPFMYAPERKDLNTTEGIIYGSKLNRCYYSDEGYAYRIFGIIDRNMIDQDGRIYVRLADAKSHNYTFEAFPILEESLLLDEFNEEEKKLLNNKEKIRGFSLYIDKNGLEGDSFDASILSGSYETEILVNVSADSEATADLDNSAVAVPNPYGDENGDHQLVYRDASIGIGDNINSLKAGLGAQVAPSEIIVSCLSGNDAVVYYYPNITIETEMDGTIYYISLMDNSYSDGKKDATTKGGLTLGSDNMKIFDLFGKPARENDKNCTYQTEHINITYTYKGGKINSITLEDRKYVNEDDFAEGDNDTPSGVKYESGVAHLYDDSNAMQTGWQIIDGEYLFFDRTSGERIVGQTVDGIEIGEDGEVNLSDYEKNKIETMIRAHQIVLENTNPSDSMEEKRRKIFDWVLSFPYRRGMRVRDYMNDEGVELLFANDFFDEEIGDCVSESAALAILFHEIGYNNVYWVHDTGHAWVRSDDKLFDPVFAEGRDFNANYDAEFTDYRKTMAHSMLIY